MHRPPVIHKTAADLRQPPNWTDYAGGRSAYSPAAARDALQGLPGGGLNIGFEAVDRLAATALRDRTALRFVARNAPPLELSYGELVRQTNRFANVLQGLGVSKGDRLFVLAGRIPELYVAVLGALKNGTVVTPMFSAFGPEPIATRINIGSGQVLVTTDRLYQRKVKPVRAQMPTLRHVLLVAEDGGSTDEPGTLDLATLLRDASDAFNTAATTADDPALLHFTSGTTGEPKGAVHVHQAVVYHKESGKFALNLKPQDVFWCTADPGWVTGTSYGIISPLCNGATLLIDGAEFNATRWYKILEYFKVDVWYTAPTAMRMLMKAGEELPQKYDLSHVRFASSVGEPLNPEVIKWVRENLSITLHDNWWQTETGGIIIANDANSDVKPGSMGKPLPGIEVALIKNSSQDKIEFAQGEEQGEIAVRKGWPSMFTAYLENPQRYEKCFVQDWYLSGDLARQDEEGHYWFVGRKDDVIKTSGHLIGPFEVENILMDHPAVLESAVIGLPDPMIGEVIKAFVVLKKDLPPTEEQKLQILGHARRKLGAALAPREIQFIENLPKTRSGKIMRRLLKARELGMPEGDLSTLEEDSGSRPNQITL